MLYASSACKTSNQHNNLSERNVVAQSSHTSSSHSALLRRAGRTPSLQACTVTHHGHVHCTGICVTVDGNGLHPEPAGGADHAASDLAPIRNQDLVEQARHPLRCRTHQRNLHLGRMDSSEALWAAQQLARQHPSNLEMRRSRAALDPFDHRGTKTPPIVTEYKMQKLARARVRWRSFKVFTWGLSIGVGLYLFLDPHGVNEPRGGHDHALADFRASLLDSVNRLRGDREGDAARQEDSAADKDRRA